MSVLRVLICGGEFTLPDEIAGPWNQHRRVVSGKLSYERSLRFYVNIVRLYVWIPRSIPRFASGLETSVIPAIERIE
jgi:hypothetical protein